MENKKPINPVDMDTKTVPDVTPLDGAAEYEKQLNAKDAEIAKLKKDYATLVNAFNMLADDYNAMHIQGILLKAGNVK